MRHMRWVVWMVVGLVGLAATVALIGAVLPQNHEASGSTELSRPASDVYALVSDVRNYPAWWSDISKVEMLSDVPGPIRFREHMSTGPVVMAVAEASPPTRFVTKIDDPGQPFGGTWTFEIAPLGDARARLTITERGEIYNPIFRFMARFVFGYTATLDSFLGAAEKRLR